MWTLTRGADGSPNLYLHAGHVKDDGGVEWENPYWHPVTEEVATHYASTHPPRHLDVRLWGRPDETLVAVWEGDDWEEDDPSDEYEDDDADEPFTSSV